MKTTIAICIAAAAFSPGVLSAQTLTQLGLAPNRTRIWDEAELSKITLPPALPEGKILYLPSVAYYKLKPLSIYKTYPVYHPDREPNGYFEWLRKQEPEIAFNPQRLESESSWRAAGRIVFEAPTDFAPAETIHNQAWFIKVQPPVAKDGTIPAYSYVIRKKGVVEVGTGGCITCHSRILPDGTYIAGAQGNFPLERAYAERLTREHSEKAPPRFALGLLLPSMQVAKFTEHLYERSNEEIIATSEAMIPGVAMRNGFSFLDPPKIADLIGVRDRRYLDRTARLIHRSLADIARYGSMCWAFNYFFSREDSVPEAAVAAVSDNMRYSDEQAYAFAVYVYSLDPPANPNQPSAVTGKGKAIFEREGCPTCHTPPLYTNNKIIPAGNFEPPAGHRGRYDILDARVGTDSAAALMSLRGRGYYKVPSLKGVWYRGPFVHNGTVATLEDWFDSRRLRKDYIPTGYRAHGVQARPVPGHPFGLSLNTEEKSSLIAFLRTL
jgi:mono/diheme cytochrome c family protein